MLDCTGAWAQKKNFSSVIEMSAIFYENRSGDYIVRYWYDEKEEKISPEQYEAENPGALELAKVQQEEFLARHKTSVVAKKVRLPCLFRGSRFLAFLVGQCRRKDHYQTLCSVCEKYAARGEFRIVIVVPKFLACSTGEWTVLNWEMEIFLNESGTTVLNTLERHTLTIVDKELRIFDSENRTLFFLDLTELRAAFQESKK